MVNTLIPISHFDEVLDSFFGPRWTRNQAQANSQALPQVPHADILEGDKDFLIRLDLPGVDRKTLDLNLEDQVLTIKAERELPAPEGYKAHRKELPGKVVLKRSFNLGSEIDAENISAKLEDGVLTVTLPKTDQALPRRIEVK
jgi:HSP20 family protein